MVNVFVELSKYTILTFMVLYTLLDVRMVLLGRESPHSRRACRILLFLMLGLCFAVLYVKTRDERVLFFALGVFVYIFAILIAYRIIYPRSSMRLLGDMCTLLGIGFVMLGRLDLSSALRQLIICAAISALGLIVPVMVRRMRFLKRLAPLYALLGVMLLLAVLVLARTSYGAKLSLLGIQPSEAIKITFVFFLASMLWRYQGIRELFISGLVAALHVGILVLSRDLGSAVIFFVTFLVMVYVSTRRVSLLALGTVCGAGASVVAYHLFGHVRQRVSAWKDPMAVYENEGYQIVQSLFAIGTGGWFGMGLCQGSPLSIPVVKNDFIFSAICEEMGALFAVCLIILCLCLFLTILQIALEIRSPFYKLVALGLGTEYAFQVFLTIGGATKLIPLTGVTLPLVSYGGSSLGSTLLMLGIIQGLFIFREDEEEEIERLRREANARAHFHPFRLS